MTLISLCIAGEVVENAADRGLLAEAQILRDHDRAGGALRILGQTLGIGRLFGGHFLEDRLGFVRREAADEIGLLVARQQRDDVSGRLWMKLGE